MFRPLVAAVALMGLAACSTSQLANTTQTVTAAKTALQAAINGYGIVKGIAGVAAAADPTLAGPIAAAEVILDPLVVKAQTALNDASTDAATLVSLASTITAQAQALQATAAPAIKVVPSTP